MQKQIKPDSIVYTDHYRSYNVLDVSEFKHYRINHSKLFADKQNHIVKGRVNSYQCGGVKVYHSG